ncbi:DUF4296 domain-containing protein [Pedobacter polaris]|uniref:DUF4296 domain-containing protein n=1 Tax=Pedobacter polaris TaxID=2571273 RepID=A0A4U1CHJ1_9SPHI|nr:DUF4296 domain-containing protein [Pedobacter polaris]TKC06765.1 DUF4296 domain-containing protein [Pedobacter polaris]
MKRFFFLIIVCVSFYACKPGIPKELIQPDKMEQVLLDIHIVDGYISGLPSLDTSKKVASAYYKGVYKKFEIDSALYSQSMNYYYKHPDLMKKMYDSITVKLSKLKEENTLIVSDPPESIYFKGIFAKVSGDDIFLDHNLNLNYNSRALKNNVFSTLTNSQSLELNGIPKAQPSLTNPNTQIGQPVTITEPVQVPKAQ